jgi:arylsulfatase A-like enzyme
LAAIASVGLLGTLGTGDGLLGENQRVEAQSDSRPNIVFIMTDDLDERSMEKLGGIRNVMGSNGTTFQNAYVTYSLCCPSRATILRGQYPHNHDIIGNASPEGGALKFRKLERDKSTIATWLHDAGYRTKLIGKYMNSYIGIWVPPGWDEWYALKQGTGPYGEVNENGHWTTLGGHSAYVFADKASDFIKRSSDSGEPFFLMLNSVAPHNPPEVDPRYQDKFTTTPLPQPDNFNEPDVSDKPEWIRSNSKLSQTAIDRIQREYRNRLRSMLSVEDLIRQTIATLQETRELDNTYIFFTSDNGYHLGNHRLGLGKRAPYEEDIGVPLMVRGPGVPAGEVRQELVLNNDFAPTIADLAGASTPPFVDGRSFAPLLTGSEPYASRSAFLEEGWFTEDTNTQPPTHKGLHTQDHMFVEYNTGEHELYDLKADPYQLQSLPQADNQQLYSQMQSRLDALEACKEAICRANEWDTQVISTIPNANATAVAPTANVQATFSEDMLVSSINATTFKLMEQGSTTQIAATLNYDASTDTATLDPTTSLQSGVTYKAVVTTGAKDVAGNPLDQNPTTAGLQQKTWLFTVS